MQEKLYMTQHPGTNPPSFSSIITEIIDENIFLKDSYCYPRGGGQPGDTGVISNSDAQVRLLETLPGESIIHPLESVEGFSIGDEIKCVIDQQRRNKNTKMHTVQHIFSAMANDLFEAETVGNQIGDEKTRIDLLFPDRDKFMISDLEESVNNVIKSHKNVNIHRWDRKSILSHEQMRHTKFMDRIPNTITELRVVEIEDIDLCPCAGTHVEKTSELSEMEIVNVKSKGSGKLRITYQLKND
ncbi:MAG: alanyl-tRNA editing protein [Candidatus Thalassarchaeaceae archaeon]|nr:alanyl-tRNA editing protein [Candidatus Thalassarchaeaceae archaeon]